MDNAPRADAADAQIVGLLSPHIDYPRGGITYAHVWNRSAQAARNADLVVIIATDHYGDDPFTLTRQHFATPFGVLPTAAKIVDKLAAAIGEEQAFAGELRHVGEHSIELVVNWLHHVRNGEPCEIVPILCGSYAHFHPTRQGEPSQEALDQIVAVLRSELVSRNVLVVASGDLSHVGSAFGGSPLDAARRAAVKDADDRLIRHMSTGNSDAFLEEIHAASDVNNVCGAAPIYLTMRTLGDVHGEMTSYATCPADEIDTSAVTISGIVFQHANGSA